jgi:hypothetical protein
MVDLLLLTVKRQQSTTSSRIIYLNESRFSEKQFLIEWNIVVG